MDLFEQAFKIFQVQKVLVKKIYIKNYNIYLANYQFENCNDRVLICVWPISKSIFERKLFFQLQNNFIITQKHLIYPKSLV